VQAIDQTIRIGTRGSPLALAQAHEVRRRLAAAHGMAEDAIVTIVIRTSGDRIQDRPLSEIGGKGLFTKEIEEALLAETIDLAVHSMKDVPTVLPDGLEIVCHLAREDVRDAFLSVRAATLAELPKGAVVGTSSLRRQAQVLRARPDLRVIPFRGNVETRLRRLAEGAADATLLACAGLRRLGLADRITAPLETEDFLPAIAQGAIGIEIRSSDDRARALLVPLDHAPTSVCVAAERALLARLDGSCRTPIAGLAELHGGRLTLRGMILSTDGRVAHATERRGTPNDGAAMGSDAADELLGRAGPGFLSGRTSGSAA
jgi:hydroxymethylbilane synthase